MDIFGFFLENNVKQGNSELSGKAELTKTRFRVC